MYNSPVARYTFVYHQGRLAALAYHHASACIYLRLDDILAKSEIYSRFCAGDIQRSALMIYTPLGVMEREPPLHLITRRRAFSCAFDINRCAMCNEGGINVK
jgi:hypothetical protein